MKVIYDISVLGIGFFENRARTGIARVVDNLAIELSQRSDLELRFSAYQSPITFYQTLEYLHTQKVLQAKDLARPETGFGRKFISLYERLGLADSRLILSRNLMGKLNRRAQQELYTRFLAEIVDLSGTTNQDILHTPFLPFPKNSEQKTKLIRFITIYDLIPILHPEYFKFKESAQLEKMIGCIGPNDFAFAISECTKNDLCNYTNIDPAKVFVTPLAAASQFVPCVDNEALESTRRKYGIPDEPYVLSLCTLEPRKNIAQTIKSFCALLRQEKINDLNLVLVGSKGWKFNAIFAAIDESDLARERIIVTGFVPKEDLSPLYSGAMMFVYPSLYEGFGLPPLEAMQCGVPVVTSNTSSLPEVVGEAGILADPADGDAICHEMLNLYRSEKLRQALSEKGLQRAAGFSWKKCADATVKAYFQVG